MISIARSAHQLLFAIAFTLIGISGCSKPLPIDPWEAVKLAHEAKNRADLLTALQQVPAELYALKLFTDCKSDKTKCAEAMHVLEFTYILTEGENSTEARMMCELRKIFALGYLFDISSNLQFKLAENLSDADAALIRARLREIEKIQDRYIKQCERYK